MNKKIVALIILVLVVLSTISEIAYADSKQYTVGELEELIDGIVAWKTDSMEVKSPENMINQGLSKSAGSSGAEWYVIGLNQYGKEYRYDEYLTALNSYVVNVESISMTDRLRIALAYAVLYQEVVDDTLTTDTDITTGVDYINSVIADSKGQTGITTCIYSLILYDCGIYNVDDAMRTDIIETILSSRLSDGGWALYGEVSDPDITAMMLQALAPYNEGDIKPIVEEALKLLSDLQLEDGDYTSFGTRNPETGTQVLLALCSLGIDPQTDERFIKNNHTLIDGLLLYHKGDGSFSHTLDGPSNNTASVQAMNALIAVWRLENGQDRFYQFVQATEDNSVNDIVVTPTTAGEQAETEAALTDKPLNQEAQTSDIAGITNQPDNMNTQLEDVNTTSQTNNDNSDLSIKMILSIIILSVTILLILLRLLTCRDRFKDCFLILAVGIIALVLVYFTKIQSVKEYYLVNIEEVTPESETIQLSIRCDVLQTVVEGVEDGYLLPAEQYVLREGDSVYDLLERSIRYNKIPMETGGVTGNTSDTVYIKGIYNIYEKQYGDLSGWMYRVNGEFPSVSCTEYFPIDGDIIEWVYSLNMGKDVE